MYLFPKYYATKISSDKAKIVFRHGLFRRHKEVVAESVDSLKIMDVIDEHHSKKLPNQIKSILFTFGDI